MTLADIKCKYAPVKGFEDYYITENGEVFSQRLRGKETVRRLRKLTAKDPGRLDKYLNITLCRDDGQYSFMIHRLVAEHFVDGWFEGAVVNHIDGNSRNNSASNLEWVTQKENIHKSYATSSLDQTRNYLWWYLYSPEKMLLGAFKGQYQLAEYVKSHSLPVSPSSLAKYMKSCGYTVVKKLKN